MKKMWSEPSIQVQQFTPNEYVAVCWGVGCDTGAANSYEADHWEFGDPIAIHNPNQCGNPNNQYLIDLDGDNQADAMRENSSQGILECTFYSDATYQTPIDISDVTLGSGQRIYWTTTIGDWIKTTYHHQGNIIGYDEAHKNRS